MNIEIEEIDDWQSLNSRIDEYFTNWREYIFRGQADAEWSLEPTLTRALKKTYPNDKNKFKNWTSSLIKFRYNIRGRCLIDFSTISDDELWTLGQHYGLNTPMLDWSKSPYVALFFALQSECKSGKRALWAILPGDIPDLYKIKKIHIDEQVKIIEPLTHHNTRLVSQRGLFLKIPPTQSFDELIKIKQNHEHAFAYKFIFSDKIKEEALAALDRKNINHATLFPDLTGAALNTNYEFESEKYFDEIQEKAWEMKSNNKNKRK